MTWTPDEQVEKVARILAAHANPDITEFDDFWDLVLTPTVRDRYRHTARAVLVAVGPHVAAQALRDAAESHRPACAEGLLQRADTIEKEAGR